MAFKKDYPSIGCYAQAARLYNETKPLRNNVTRPIGRRSKGNPCRIEKDGDVYSILLHATRVVTYRPDGSVVLLWREAYDAYGVRETVQIALPYGQVD